MNRWKTSPSPASVDDAERRIKRAFPRAFFRVRVVWDTGPEGSTDAETINIGPAVFEDAGMAKLRNNRNLLTRVREKSDGSGLEWPGGIELSVERIRKLSKRPREVDTTGDDGKSDH